MIGLTIKITGSLLIAAGGILTGLKIRKEYKQRRTLLKAFQDALHYADDAIAIENALLDDVLMNCGAKFFPDEKGSDLFSCAAGCLRSEFGSFENAWAKACADFFPKTPCLREKDIECISGIGTALGLANTQRQSAPGGVLPLLPPEDALAPGQAQRRPQKAGGAGTGSAAEG